MRQPLRKLHSAIWDAVVARKYRKAERLLERAPAQYRGVTALLVFAFRMTH